MLKGGFIVGGVSWEEELVFGDICQFTKFGGDILRFITSYDQVFLKCFEVFVEFIVVCDQTSEAKCLAVNNTFLHEGGWKDLACKRVHISVGFTNRVLSRRPLLLLR